MFSRFFPVLVNGTNCRKWKWWKWPMWKWTRWNWADPQCDPGHITQWVNDLLNGAGQWAFEAFNRSFQTLKLGREWARHLPYGGLIILYHGSHFVEVKHYCFVTSPRRASIVVVTFCKRADDVVMASLATRALKLKLRIPADKACEWNTIQMQASVRFAEPRGFLCT